jgi:hypothetical protein
VRGKTGYAASAEPDACVPQLPKSAYNEEINTQAKEPPTSAVPIATAAAPTACDPTSKRGEKFEPRI